MKEMLEIYAMATENLTDPIGIDTVSPSFSWKLKSDRKGVFQKSRRVVIRSEKGIVFDSGIVESEETRNISFKELCFQSRERLWWTVYVTVEDKDGETETAVSSEAYFEMGLIHKSDWKASWIEPEKTADPDLRKPAPYIRKKFYVNGKIKKARIYQSAHGLYEFYINGTEGTGDRFKPGLTSYYYRIQYQVYDIADYLKQGENCLAVILADGWWRGITGGTIKNNFGYKLGYMGQIEIEYEDGRIETIISDESFRTKRGGLLASDMMMGDIYDARQEPEGWKMPGFDDSDWKKVQKASELPEHSLIASMSYPVREREIFHPVLIRDADGCMVLDFGQNFAGYVSMRIHDCEKGRRIRLVHGEGLKDGKFSIANINKTSIQVDAFQEIVYVSSGLEEQEYCPRFSVFGFRYVLVENYPESKAEDYAGIAVYSDLPALGQFTCSNPWLNRLAENSLWSQKSNFLDVAVDCPTRERNAWTGDAQVYVKTSTLFMDTYPFYEKWLKDQAIEQYASGKVGITFPSTSSTHQKCELEKAVKTNPHAALAGPEGNGNIGEDAVAWGDSAVWIPYVVYLCSGNRRILENQYQTAKNWVDFMAACARDKNPKYEGRDYYRNIGEDGECDGNYIYDTNFQYGEWNEPIEMPIEEKMAFYMRVKEAGGDVLKVMAEDGNPETATAYFARSAQNVADMAAVLGNYDDARKYEALAERIRDCYDRYFISEDGMIRSGHQAPYVRALAFHLVSDSKKDKVIVQLKKEVEKADYHLNTGFLSTPFLLFVLAEHEDPETAYRILLQEGYPGWLYSVKKGLTTIPESWKAVDEFEESLNHYSYGAVCDFLFSGICGIRPVWKTPGYRQFEIKPIVGKQLNHAFASYESPYGRIVSGWERTADKMRYHFEIPVGTSAEVMLKDEKFNLGSGNYDFLL